MASLFRNAVVIEGKQFRIASRVGLIHIANFNRYRRASFDGVKLWPVFTSGGVGMTPSLYPDVQKRAPILAANSRCIMLQLYYTQ